MGAKKKKTVANQKTTIAYGTWTHGRTIKKWMPMHIHRRAATEHKFG
jgi:hypothetical protein